MSEGTQRTALSADASGLPYDRVDQFHQSVDSGDAISGEMLALRSVLRGMGYRSDVFAERVGRGCEGEVRRLSEYAPARRQLLLWHFSIGVDCFERIATARHDIAVVYHNITPERFITEPLSNFYLHLGRQQLRELRDVCVGAIADSNFNRRELIATGFRRADVLPVWADGRTFRPATAGAMRRSADWLFVGRIIPSKGQVDLVKAFACYQRTYDPAGRLVLVGNTTYHEYVDAVFREIEAQGVTGRVEVLGKVAERELLEVMWSSGVYVSLSEHEGFGVPLLEAMAAGLAVVAVGSAAVGETMGDAGIVVESGDPQIVADAVASLRMEPGLLDRTLSAQGRRVGYFETFDRAAVLEDVIDGCAGFDRPLRVAAYGPTNWVEQFGELASGTGSYPDVAVMWDEGGGEGAGGGGGEGDPAGAQTAGIVVACQAGPIGDHLVRADGKRVSVAEHGGWANALEEVIRKAYVPQVALVALNPIGDGCQVYLSKLRRCMAGQADMSSEFGLVGEGDLADELALSVVDVVHVVIDVTRPDPGVLEVLRRIVEANSGSKGIVATVHGYPTAAGGASGWEAQLSEALTGCDFLVAEGSDTQMSELADIYRDAADSGRRRRGLPAAARRYAKVSASAAPSSE